MPGATLDAEVQALVGPAVARILARRGVHGEGAVYIKRAAEESHDEVLADLVKNFKPEWARTFSQVNKVVSHPSSGRPIVVPRVQGLDAQPLSAMGPEGQRALQQSREADLRIQAKRNRRGRDRKRKIYKLIDFFTDHAVAAKFELTEADLQLVRRTAVIDAAAAARNLQTQLQNYGHDCAVVPGDYAKGIKSSRARLHRALENTRVAKPDVDMLFLGETAIVEGPRDVNGRPAWSVSGSARNSPEVAAVARLAMLHGVLTVRALFEEDLVTCGVELVEEGRPIGTVDFHYGGFVPFAEGLAGTDGMMFGDSVRAAAARVLPLVQGGRVVATAVRMSSEMAYANWHVLEKNREDAVLTVSLPGNVPFSDVARLHEVAADVWAIEHQPAAFEQGTWVVREADVEESCVLVYATSAGVEFSDPVSVVRKEAGTIVTTRPAQARKGVSGAALVALNDGALLGVYRGASFDLCSCAVVTPTARGVSSSAMEYVLPPSKDSVADSAFEQMAQRGLDRVLRQSLAALCPVYSSGTHIGYTARYGQSTYTTIDCDVWPLTDVTGRTLGFERVHGDKFKADAIAGQSALGFVRLPRIGEKVYVMGNDTDGVYMSAPMSITRLASDHQAFWLSGDPAAGSEEPFVFAGALVVADSDGAVVGQFSSALSTALGVMSRCVGFVSRTTAPSTRRENVLNTVGPGAMVELWDPETVRGLVDRDEATITRYAALGQSVLQAVVVVEAGRSGGNLDLSAAMSVVSDSSWIGSRAFDCGFHQALRPISGAGPFVRPTEKLADAFRAFVGMMATWQGQDEVMRMLQELGWFEFEWGEEASRLGSAMRSPHLLQGPWGSRTSTPSPKPV